MVYCVCSCHEHITLNLKLTLLYSWWCLSYFRFLFFDISTTFQQISSFWIAQVSLLLFDFSSILLLLLLLFPAIIFIECWISIQLMQTVKLYKMSFFLSWRNWWFCDNKSNRTVNRIVFHSLIYVMHSFQYIDTQSNYLEFKSVKLLSAFVTCFWADNNEFTFYVMADCTC